ncbi:MAG: hypothetical protein PHY48_17805, partial [Candidatus Cloacimonetes bacterium]|nr:hypothetical protein [Candidatus Cloacimonadota bacterium]
KAVNGVTSNKGALIAGAVALGVVGSMRKEAGLMDDKFVTHYAMPFVGAHLASAHYRNKFMRGEELNGLQQFVAENPDYISVAAPFAMHFGSKKLNASATKVASTEKIADFADTLSQAALTGIFRGRGMSGMGNLVDQGVDSALMHHTLKITTPKDQPVVQPPKINYQV